MLNGLHTAVLSLLWLAPLVAEEPLVAGRDVPPPKRLLRVNARFPHEALITRSQGLVVLQVLIDVEGRPAQVTVVRSRPPFDAAALEAVKQWRYEPSVKNGVPVTVTTFEPVEFLLGDGPGVRGYAALANDANEHPAARRYAISRLLGLAPGHAGQVEKALRAIGGDAEPSVREAAQSALAALSRGETSLATVQAPRDDPFARYGRHQRRIREKAGSLGLVLDFDTPPKPEKLTAPKYPETASGRWPQGTVVAMVVVDAEGRVAEAEIVESIPALDEAALKAVRSWRFKPAMKDGRPVATVVLSPVTFVVR